MTLTENKEMMDHYITHGVFFYEIVTIHYFSR